MVVLLWLGTQTVPPKWQGCLQVPNVLYTHGKQHTLKEQTTQSQRKQELTNEHHYLREHSHSPTQTHPLDSWAAWARRDDVRWQVERRLRRGRCWPTKADEETGALRRYVGGTEHTWPCGALSFNSWTRRQAWTLEFWHPTMLNPKHCLQTFSPSFSSPSEAGHVGTFLHSILVFNTTHTGPINLLHAHHSQ